MNIVEMQPPLPSTKPYLLRALWEWCNDHGFTPHMVVAADKTCCLPQELVQNGQIVFNIGLEATHSLNIQNDAITFQARFGGAARDIYIPVTRVTALYARENGVGMGFPAEESNDAPVPEISTSSLAPVPVIAGDSAPDTPVATDASSSSAGFLRIIK
jgi:stringent starvation protein B